MTMKIVYRNIASEMRALAHGTHVKNMFVCHETVSYNALGWGDINGIIGVLQHEGYGIHGIVDQEGHKCWAYNLGNAVFWHAGGVNSVANGVELVSEIPILIASKHMTHKQAHKAWLKRTKQLNGLAQLMAGWHNSDKKNHPLVRSNGMKPGVCSHWDVSQHHPESEGHWDCWPFDAHPQGYFPLEHVLDLAKKYAAQGLHL